MSAMTSDMTARALSASDAPPCMLCGGERFAPQFNANAPQAVQRDASEPYRITRSERHLIGAIVRCLDCGLVTLPPVGSHVVDYGDAADPYYVEQAAERIANAHRLLEFAPAGGRLLEIGSACGFLLVAARERGYAAQGVEMSAWASGYARNELGLDVKTGRLEDQHFADESFDVVVMADVIEHLTDPRGTVREIQRILRRGGRLLVLTPDLGSIVARVTGQRWWGLLDDHYFYFSRTTLEQFLVSEGFSVERIAAHGRQFPLAHWLSKLSQYNVALHDVVARLTRALGLDQLQVTINLGDMMACVARKK